MFVISKLNVKTNTCELINMFKTEEECIKCITESLDPSSSNSIYKIKLNNNVKTIEEYSKRQGIIYNSEALINIYQILPLPDKTQYTTSLCTKEEENETC